MKIFAGADAIKPKPKNYVKELADKFEKGFSTSRFYSCLLLTQSSIPLILCGGIEAWNGEENVTQTLVQVKKIAIEVIDQFESPNEPDSNDDEETKVLKVARQFQNFKNHYIDQEDKNIELFEAQVSKRGLLIEEYDKSNKEKSEKVDNTEDETENNDDDDVSDSGLDI